MNTLRERIQWALNNSGLTQADLVRATHRTRAAVSDWFTGATQSLKGDTLLLAARALKVRPEWLATGVGTPTVSATNSVGALSELEAAAIAALRGLTVQQQETAVAELRSQAAANRSVIDELSISALQARRSTGPLQPYGFTRAKTPKKVVSDL